MSRLYFHSQHGQAELLGTERHHLRRIVNQLTAGFLSSIERDQVEQLRTLVRPRHYMHYQDRTAPGWIPEWRDTFRIVLSGVGSDEEFLVWKGQHIDAWALRLNTALRYGGTAVKLAARLDGQSSIHCYVEGPARAWLAGIIHDGLEAKIFREGQWLPGGSYVPAVVKTWHLEGWRDVIALLLERDDEPVVTSYSTDEWFPNSSRTTWAPPPMPEAWAPAWAAGQDGRAKWDARYPDPLARQAYYDEEARQLWDELPYEEKWRTGLEALRAQPARLEIAPDELGTHYFAHSLAITDLLAEDYAARLDAALGTPEAGT